MPSSIPFISGIITSEISKSARSESADRNASIGFVNALAEKPEFFKMAARGCDDGFVIDDEDRALGPFRHGSSALYVLIIGDGRQGSTSGPPL
jgi:hypothetical protein